MSTGPTFYYPTTNQPYRRILPAVSYYYDNSGNTIYDVTFEKRLNFYLDPSHTYSGPIRSGGFDNYYLPLNKRREIALSDPAYTNNEILKQLPIEKRGLQPFLFNNTILFQFANDALYIPGNTLGMYDSSGVAFDKPNSYFGLWPDFGISFTNQWTKEVFESMAEAGATLSYMLIDNEISFPETTSSILAAITGATYYNLPWRGLSSWLDYYISESGNTNFIFTNTDEGRANARAYSSASYNFKNKSMTDAFVPELTKLNSNGIVSDYDEYISKRISGFPGYTLGYVLSEYSPPLASVRRSYAGNAQSPVLYGWFSVGPVVEMYRFKENTPTVSIADPRIIFNYDYSYTDSVFNKYFSYGPWSSFISVMSEMKEAKRNAPNIPITPWIPSPWQGGQYNWSVIYKSDSQWNKSPSQIPVEVVHNRWRFKNINTETGGFSGPTGLTNGIRIVSSSTTTQKLLSYVYDGLTSGQTYVFSYYVNLGCGYTGFGAGFDNFRRTHYNIPTGITYYQTLPSVTGPFFLTGPIYYPPGSSGWTKVQFKFSFPNDDLNDPIFNTTLEAMVVEDSVTNGNNTSFITNPIFETEATPDNIPVLNVTSILSEDNQILWNWGAPCGFAQIIRGYNPRQAAYIVLRDGNSGYFYEMIRHCCLMGTKAFGWFNPASYVDNSYPGARAYGFEGQKQFESGKQNIALTKGFSGFIDDYKLMNQTLHDVHLKIKGFTTATAGATDYWNWSLPYFASAAPDTKGQTWWWRITAQNGYTLYVNGMTLPDSNGNVGLWLGTTGPTLAGVSITHTEPIPPKEPIGYTGVREFYFDRMSSISDLTGNCFTFSRGSTASYIGANGSLTFAGPNIPRFHYDPLTLRPRGILLEVSTTNQLNWSETFASTGGVNNNWIDTNLSRISGNISPSNDLSAIRFTATSGNATLLSSTPVSNSSNAKVFSFWIKGVTGNENVEYTVNGGTNWYSIPKINTNWQRVAFGPRFAGLSSAFAHHVGFRLGNTNDSILLWGAQLENYRTSINVLYNPTDNYTVPQQTSYIKTTNITTTRSADSLTYTGSTSWINGSYGTFLLETENLWFDTGLGNFQIKGLCAGTTFTTDIALGPDHQGIRFDYFDRQPGSTFQTVLTCFYAMTTRKPGPDTPYKYLLGYSQRGFKLASNSIVQSYERSKPLGVINSFIPPNDCTLKTIRYWDKVLEDSIMRQFALGGVTQIGWLNNGDGEPMPVTYYRANQNL